MFETTLGAAIYYIGFWAVVGIMFMMQEDKVGKAEMEIRMAVYRNNADTAVDSLRNAQYKLGLSPEEYEQLVANTTEFAKQYKKDRPYDFSQMLYTGGILQPSRSEKSLAAILDDKISKCNRAGGSSAESLNAKDTGNLNDEVNELLFKWIEILKFNHHLMSLEQIPLIKFLEIREEQIKRIQADRSIANKQEHIQKVEREILLCIESWNAFKKYSQENERKKMIALSTPQKSSTQD